MYHEFDENFCLISSFNFMKLRTFLFFPNFQFVHGSFSFRVFMSLFLNSLSLKLFHCFGVIKLFVVIGLYSDHPKKFRKCLIVWLFFLKFIWKEY